MADPNAYGEGPPARQGSSAWAWILGIGGVALLLCCGGVGFGVWKVTQAAKQFIENAAIEDPVKIREQTAAMLQIEIPDKYQPKLGMNLGVFRMAIYQTEPEQPNPDDLLMLMEMTQFGANNQQQEQQLRQSMQQQMQQQRGNQNFKSSKSETREIEIRGKKVSFEFTEGITGEPGEEKTVHMVSGIVQGKTGPVMLQLVAPDENYDEAQVLKMLESIK
jgi:hypothetical protein